MKYLKIVSIVCLFIVFCSCGKGKVEQDLSKPAKEDPVRVKLEKDWDNEIFLGDIYHFGVVGPKDSITDMMITQDAGTAKMTELGKWELKIINPIDTLHLSIDKIIFQGNKRTDTIPYFHLSVPVRKKK